MTVVTDNDTPYSHAVIHAYHAHRGQYRDYSKQEHIHHVIRVSEIINKNYQHRDDIEALRVTAILHDVLEDTWLTTDDLKPRFDDEIVDSVVALSHDATLPDDERHKQYKEQLRHGPDKAKIVKVADIYDNTNDTMPDPERYRRYLRDSQEILRALHVDDPTFTDQKNALLNDIEERLNDLR